MTTIRRTSNLEHCSLKKVWHKEVVGLLHVFGVVGTTQVNLVMARHVVLNAVKRVTSLKSALRTHNVVGIRETEPNLH